MQYNDSLSTSDVNDIPPFLKAHCHLVADQNHKSTTQLDENESISRYFSHMNETSLHSRAGNDKPCTFVRTQNAKIQKMSEHHTTQRVCQKEGRKEFKTKTRLTVCRCPISNSSSCSHSVRVSFFIPNAFISLSSKVRIPLCLQLLCIVSSFRNSCNLKRMDRPFAQPRHF